MNQAEEIKNRLDIVDIIRDYLPLKASGANFKANCPFHSEKSPSFMVSPEKQIYHCFGCGKGGDLIGFVMEIENIDFLEALRILAPKAGVVLKNFKKQDNSKKTRLFDIMNLASRYFYKSLNSTKSGEKMLEYLKNRGINDSSIEYWRLGYSQNSWDDLLLFLLKNNYSEKEILQAGLISSKQSGGGYYNRFRDRIMFPIFDINSNVIAFTGRVNPFDLKVLERGGKYINSPETELFQKSKVLYGLDKAKHDIRKENLAIVVEGQTDVILAHQAGFKNVIASSGTALTKDQLLILKRYSENIALSFDMDGAGQMAADRGIVEALALEMNVRVITLAEGKDPAELIASKKELFSQAIKESKSMMDYYINKILSDYDISEIEKKRLATVKIINMISKIVNQVERDHWLKYTARKLDVSYSILSEMIVKNNSKNNITIKNSEKNNKTKQVSQTSREEKLSNLSLSLLLKFKDIINYAISELDISLISGNLNKEFYKHLIIYYNKDNSLNFSQFCQYLEKQESNLLNKIRELVLIGERDYYNFQFPEAKAEFITLISELKKIYKKNLSKNLEREISKLEEEGSLDEADKLLKELQQLNS